MATCDCTTTYTIAEAIRECDRRNSCYLPLSCKPIDVLAVVTTIQCHENYCRVGIEDPSRMASVLYFGSTKSRQIKDELHSGDVVRFNRINVKDFSRSTSSFVHSLSDPEAGPEYFRICSIQKEGVIFNSDQTPESMKTSQECLDQLTAWYLQSDETKNELSSLPCHWRSISAMQTCLGTVSNIVGYVREVETVQPSMKKIGKRKRSGQIQATTYATITDSEGSITLRVENRRFDAILCQACRQKIPVKLSNVISRAAKDNHEVLLELTYQSDIVIAQEDSVLSPESLQSTQPQTQASLSSHSHPRQSPVVVYKDSPLLDIIVKGKSLRKYKNLWKACWDEGNTYTSSILVLVDMAVPAEGSVLKILCGGLDLSEWADEKSRPIVTNMIVALIDKPVILKWKLLWSDDGYRIEDVWIPKL